MKARNILLTLLYFLCIVIVSPTKAQITINRSDIPVATYFYMPVGDKNSDIQTDLRWDFRRGTDSNPTQLFPGNYIGTDDVEYQGWYVAADFNQNRDYTGQYCYSDGETVPNCNTFHPAEDWNGNGGTSTELGQPVYATTVGLASRLGHECEYSK